MGLFFNYDKPGKGIDKDAPKKKGPFLYFELLWRKLGKLILSNMLYFIISLPVILVYHFISYSIISFILPANMDVSMLSVNQLVFILTLLITVFYGTGPISCGYTFLMRSFAREEHVWLTSDFFQKSKENFKQGLIIVISDVLILFLGSNAAAFYSAMYRNGYEIGLYMTAIVLIFMMLYTFMHFYIYQFIITFDLKMKDVLKNSFIMAIASLPMNIFLAAAIGIVSVMALSTFTPFAILMLAFLCWVSLMRFPIDFYSARVIKRKLIDTQTPEESDE